MRKLIKTLSIPVITLFSFFTFSTSVYAAPPTIEDLDLSNTVINVINNYVFTLAGLLAVIMIIYGGYMWMISGGDPQKTKTAQGTLTWAIIGLVFIVIFKLLLEIVIDFLDLV